jgi:hypothetical protein
LRGGLKFFGGITFDFDTQAHGGLFDPINQLVQRRNRFPGELPVETNARVERFDLLKRHRLKRSGSIGAAVGGRIVADDDFAVRRGHHVQFNPIDAEIDRFLKTYKRIFGVSGGKPAMSDDMGRS